MARGPLVPIERIQNRIVELRGARVLIDQDLAWLYGVETRILVRNVKRNSDRFPGDFMFQLTNQEFEELKAQRGTSTSWGGRRYPPYAFTEQGVAMLSSVLRSPQAIAVNVQIMRAFVQLRQFLSTRDEFRIKLAELEQKLIQHDAHFETVFSAIRQLMDPPVERDKRRIGFSRSGDAD